jgi:cephalosporin hydroxylase
MTPREQFDHERAASVEKMAADRPLQALSRDWFLASCRHQYSYNFTWLGQPIIQYPQDIVAMQEIIWRVQPNLIIETGVAHGGGCLLYASLLELLGGDRHVLGIDIEIRPHNRLALERHPLFERITLIEGSSVDPRVVADARRFAEGKRVLVTLDSNHTHEHVTQELRAYAPLVSRGSYLVVFDTVVEDMPADFFPNRPWGPGNNPKSAVKAFLAETDRFVVDRTIQNKLLVTVAPDGYLLCTKD